MTFEAILWIYAGLGIPFYLAALDQLSDRYPRATLVSNIGVAALVTPFWPLVVATRLMYKLIA